MAFISSIQSFSITLTSGTSGTATISSVNTSYAHVVFNGYTSDGTGRNDSNTRVELTNSTTVTAYRDGTAANVTVHGFVIEYDPSFVTSIQQGTISVGASDTSNTATISSVSTSNSLIFNLGSVNASSSGLGEYFYFGVELTNATTVTAERAIGTFGADATVGYVVVEFASGVLDSVQHKSYTTTSSSASYSDTITSVVTGQTMLIYNGCFSADSNEQEILHRAELSSSTGVTFTRAATGATSRTFKYVVAEFNSDFIDSVQRGVVEIPGASSSADATITAVDTSVTILSHLGSDTLGDSVDEEMVAIDLVSTTTVRGYKDAGSSADTNNYSYEAIEFGAGATGTTYNETISDSVTGADSLAAALTANASTAESLTGNESNAATANFNAAVSDDATAADAVTGGLQLDESIDDDVTAAESKAAALTVNTSLADNITGGETHAVAAQFDTSISEALTGGEGHAAATTYNASITEGLTGGDSATGEVGSQTFNESISEDVSAGDSMGSALQKAAQTGGAGSRRKRSPTSHAVTRNYDYTRFEDQSPEAEARRRREAREQAEESRRQARERRVQLEREAKLARIEAARKAQIMRQNEAFLLMMAV